jgi:hypothetical protein
MSDKKVIRLAGRLARAHAVEMCGVLPEGWFATFSEPTRNDEQNKRLHAMLNDIARQVEHYGKKWPAGVWKRLTVAAFMREQNEQPLMIPALDGIGVDVIYEKTSQMGVRQMANYITWLRAYGDENAVAWTEPVIAEHSLG